jgi:tetratricopeptide (TPR) repeat protein
MPDDPDSDPATNPAKTDPAKQGLNDVGSTGSTRFQRRHLAVPEDLDHREMEDLDVSHYYITTGNFTAAYARAEDAVKLYPDDELAHWALAVAADKMKKKDQAIAEYRMYLKLAPDGKYARQAERGLDDLGATRAAK